MYNLIDGKRSVRKLYTEALIGRGDITVDEAEQALRDYQAQLEKVFAETARRRRADGTTVRRAGRGRREGQTRSRRSGRPRDVPTAITREMRQARSSTSQLTLPEGFTVHPRLLPQLQRRAEMIGDGTIDWGIGEMLAFGSLLLEGIAVRLAGQDTRRGTFGQRHAVLVDRADRRQYTPLKHLRRPGGKLYVYDSLLSEFAAMGFEYGYSVAGPDALVLWEAQFGDFANGAQTIVDEFISSGEQKWGQRSAVVLLLPHGYEGQGPDHSSARIERYLQLCAEDNMTVAHAVDARARTSTCCAGRRTSEPHRPLIVFTPKSMLRPKAAASPAADFTSGHFRPVIGDAAVDPAAVRRVLLCSGKVYYDLAAERTRRAARPTPRSSGSSSCTRCRSRPCRPRSRRYPGLRGGPLGAGGAGQPGRVAVHGAAPAGGPRSPARARVPRGVVVARGRLAPPARRGAAGARRPRARLTRQRNPARVLHRPRHRGARPTARRRGGHPRVAGRPHARVRRPRTPTSRSRSSGSPPGWPASTTRTTDD